jgi:hypothetical protein
MSKLKEKMEELFVPDVLEKASAARYQMLPKKPN